MPRDIHHKLDGDPKMCVAEMESGFDINLLLVAALVPGLHPVSEVKEKRSPIHSPSRTGNQRSGFSVLQWEIN